MRFKIGTIITLLVFIECITSCDFINPDEMVPSYIQIDSISMEDEKAIGITDAWIYVNTELIGVFEMPAKVPVLTEGLSNIMISAGIKVNGVSSTRTYYPFYESYRASQELKPAETIVINPTIGYDYSITEIPWKENFEGNEIKFKHDTSVHFGFVKTSGVQIEGKYCGLIEMDSSTSLFNEVSVDEITIPENITLGFFLEMNFKSEMYFALVISVTYAGNVETKNLLYFNPTIGQWKKIYIDLYNQLSIYPAGTKFKILLNNLDYINERAFEQPLIINPRIWFDDMKIVQ